MVEHSVCTGIYSSLVCIYSAIDREGLFAHSRVGGSFRSLGDSFGHSRVGGSLRL